MTNGRAFSYKCDHTIGVEINHTLAAKKVVYYELHNYTIAIAWDCATVFFCCDRSKGAMARSAR
ncbi:MAG: hypothetical protein KME46_05430 [Brasilonema angustatum HA4187-MV1]|nr:hypothetical protein [Brasilonema angustatum HA4187-MV1]